MDVRHENHRSLAGKASRGGRCARFYWRNLLAGRSSLVLAALLIFVVPGFAYADSLASERADLRRSYGQQLEDLARWCDGQGLTDQAAQTRRWQLPQFDDRYLVRLLSSSTRPISDKPSDLAPEVAEWHARFTTLRQQQAAALFGLLPRAVKEQDVAAAYEIIYATLRENPDHESARALLGHARYESQWHPASTVRRLEKGEVWHNRFGWLPADRVTRYEQGKRFHRGRWISVEKDRKLHDKMARGWRIETDHFDVTTNHSLEAGVALAKQLDRVYNAWFQLFAPYHTTSAELKKLVRSQRPSRRTTIQHKVLYFRSRDEFIQHMGPQQPGIDRSLGIYKPSDRTAYFFAGEDQDPGTVLHEATHQLFQEASKAKRKIAQTANVWIVEGIACYMESLQAGGSGGEGGFDTVGGYDVARLPGARIRLLEDQFYVPLAELTRLNATSLRKHPRAATVYTQAAGQATFLMHYDGGRYRRALIEYLRAIYASRDRADTLAQATEQDFNTLDQQYREFLQQANSTTTRQPSRERTSNDP